MVKVTCLEILKMPSYILSNNGMLFIAKITKLDALKIAFNFVFDVIIYFLIILNIANALKSGDIRLAHWMTCLLLPLTNYTARRITFLINKKCLLSLMKDLSSDVFNRHSEQLNRHIKFIKRESRLIFRYFIFTMSISMVVFCLLPFVTNINMLIPPPFETGQLDVAYKFLHFMACFYLAVNYASFDMFYLTLLGIEVAELNILQERLIHLAQNARNTQKVNMGKIFKKVNCSVEDILKECVVLHNMIIKFTQKLSAFLSFPLFIQYACGCFIICNSILQLTIMGETDTGHVVGIIGYSSIVIIEMAAYHWLANEIIFKSNSIAISCYLSNWYELSVPCQKYLVLLMEKSQRPLIIQLYSVVNISLESLLVIIRWSYSILALIKARYN